MASWVGQEDTYGCVIAATAMLTKRSYHEMKAYLAEKYGDEAVGDSANNRYLGLTYLDAMTVMNEAGYYCYLKYRWFFNNKEREVWPPAPWAPIHYAEVVVAGGSGGSHAVVMLSDGMVFDPISPTPRRLDSYAKTNLVIGLIKDPHPVS